MEATEEIVEEMHWLEEDQLKAMAAFHHLRVKIREQRQLGEGMLGRAPVQRVPVNRQRKCHPILLPALQHHEKEVGMCDVILYAICFYRQKIVKYSHFPVHHRLFILTWNSAKDALLFSATNNFFLSLFSLPQSFPSILACLYLLSSTNFILYAL